MKKTKIICTLGPATDRKEILVKMIESGMDLARFNFSHGSHEECAKRLALLKEAIAEQAVSSVLSAIQRDRKCAWACLRGTR